MKESVCYDVCIVGAGPHALAVLSALNTPVSSLSEQQHMRRGCGPARPRSKVPRRPSVLVIDPSGEWLHEWSERFAALDISFLRSPSWAHPDAFSREALADFARREGRLEELRVVDLSASTLHGMPDIEAGYFSLPGTALFGDFCAEMARSLPLTLVRGRVVDIASASDTYELTVQTAKAERCCDQPGCKADSSGGKYHAKHVVLALGASGPPNIPREFTVLASQAESGVRPRVQHTSDWRNLALLGTCSEDTVLVSSKQTRNPATSKNISSLDNMPCMDTSIRGMCSITAEAARCIFQAKNSQQRQKQDKLATRLAAEYGISPKAVRDIWCLRTWTKETRPFWTNADRQRFLGKKLCTYCLSAGVASIQKACTSCREKLACKTMTTKRIVKVENCEPEIAEWLVDPVILAQEFHNLAREWEQSSAFRNVAVNPEFEPCFDSQFVDRELASSMKCFEHQHLLAQMDYL